MDFSKYENKLPYAQKRDNETIWKAYKEEDARLHDQFKSDLFVEFGVSKNSKAEQAFRLAWDRGHSAGHQEVYSYFEELVELIQ